LPFPHVNYRIDLTLSGKILDGKYRVETELGSGGMGAVFRATHVGTDRPVALKIIAPHLMNDADSLERFKREARAAGRLQHPNIVNVTDFGIAEVGPQRVAYLAMEYLEGFTLGQLLLRQERLPVGLAVDILEQVAIAVDEAHRLGIVHRDLKPENIWLRPNKRGGYEVKVLDFGVARFRESIVSEPEDKTAEARLASAVTAVASPELTRVGSVVGTPAYMSPEQCSGAHVSGRSDIYSLGVIAYQMFTGDLPFTGNTLELIAKHIAGTPPMLRNVPQRVAEVVMRALEKTPEERPISATAFAGALRARSEGPTMILRRAIALYALRLDEFFRISVKCQTPFLIWTLVTIPMLAMFGLRALPLVWLSMWLVIPGAAVNDWLLYLFIDHLREHPFEPISPRELLARLEALTGGSGSMMRRAFRVMRLTSTLMRASFKENLGRTPAGFLLYAFIDTGDAKKAIEMSRALGKEVSWRTRATAYAAVVLLTVTLFSLMVLNFLEAFGLSVAVADIVSRSALILIAVTLAFFAVVLSPLAVIAQAIFYYHARQAAGEDVTFSIQPRL